MRFIIINNLLSYRIAMPDERVSRTKTRKYYYYRYCVSEKSPSARVGHDSKAALTTEPL